MIQRIQSLYLLVAAVLGVLQMFTPFVKFSNSDNSECSITGLASFSFGMWHAGILISLMIILPLISIFQFKNRTKQLKITNVALFSAIGATLSANIALLLVPPDICSGLNPNYSGSGGLVLMPLAMIALLLAIRGIKKDEELVRSADRIR